MLTVLTQGPGPRNLGPKEKRYLIHDLAILLKTVTERRTKKHFGSSGAGVQVTLVAEARFAEARTTELKKFI
jgi:hypothetical protein